MKKIPNFYYSNIAKHAQKKYLSKLPEFKDARFDTSKECADIFLDILRKNGVSEEDINKIIVVSNEHAKIFKDRLSYSEKDVEKESGHRTSGHVYAYHKLKEDSAEVMPYGFTYPLRFTPKRQKDFVKAAQIREAAETTLRLYAIAAKDVLGYKEEDVKKILIELHNKVS